MLDPISNVRVNKPQLLQEANSIALRSIMFIFTTIFKNNLYLLYIFTHDAN